MWIEGTSMRKSPTMPSSFWFSLHVTKVNLVHLFMSKRESMWPASMWWWPTMSKSLFCGRFVFCWEQIEVYVILVALAREWSRIVNFLKMNEVHYSPNKKWRIKGDKSYYKQCMIYRLNENVVVICNQINT